MFRTKECEKSYKKAIKNGEIKKCPLCPRKSIEKFLYWKIIENKFPYDYLAEEHHMIVPLRHCVEDDLSIEEIEEFYNIKKTKLHKKYDLLIEGLGKNLSITDHIHVHLLILK